MPVSADNLSPTPRRPGSFVAFVALPTLVAIVALVIVVVMGSQSTIHRWRTPANIADLAASAAARTTEGSPEERRAAVRALAEWTSLCPSYAPFTVPTLADALQDPATPVKGAAAVGLGYVGAAAREALPALRAASGTSVPQFDHILAEAIARIENGRTRRDAEECEALSESDFRRRTASCRGKPAPEPVYSAAQEAATAVDACRTTTR